MARQQSDAALLVMCHLHLHWRVPAVDIWASNAQWHGWTLSGLHLALALAPLSQLAPDP